MPRRTLNIQLIQPLNTRVSGINPLPSTSGIVGNGVVGIMVVGQSIDPSSKDARYVNVFKRTVGEKIYAVKRSGLASSQTVSSGGIGSALMIWTGFSGGTNPISAYGAVSSGIFNNSTLVATNNTVTTNISSLCNHISETVVNGNPTLYITGTNSKGWFYAPAISSSIMQIVNANYPGNNSKTLAGGAAHMDGYTFQMDTTGAIWNSNLNTISTWTATGYINAGIYPDQGIGCVRWRQYIIGFGTESMEFFYNAGNAAGSPLSRIANMALKVGAVSADAITSLSDALFWTGSTSQGGLSVYMWDGQISRISPPELDAIIVLAGASTVKMTSFRDQGLSFVLVKAGNQFYCYVVEEKFWFVWTSHLGFCRFAAVSAGANQVVYAVSELATTGKLYTINPASRVYADDGTFVQAQVQTQRVDPGNGQFVSYEKAELVGDTEVSSSPATLTWSDDDYGTAAAGRTLDMVSTVPFTTRLGGTKKPRSFNIAHATSQPMRLEKLRVQVNVGR